MRKNDFYILLFVFSLFFVDLVPLNVNLLNNTFTLSLNNITTYFYIALSLYVLFNVLQYLKNNGLTVKLINMYTFGFLISLFMLLYTFDINFINNILTSSDVFVLFFGKGDSSSALAIVFNVIFSLIFLAANIGLYFIVAYPVYELLKKIKSQVEFFKYLNIAFMGYVGSRALIVLFDFFINVNSLHLNITTFIAFFLFLTWLLNILAIISLIIIKIIIILNIYLKLTNGKIKSN